MTFFARLAAWWASKHARMVLAAWWASKHASTILAAGVVALIGLHYANLKSDAAACNVHQELRQFRESVAKQLEEIRNAERDEAINRLRETDHPCLDAVLDDLLLDVSAGEVQQD